MTNDPLTGYIRAKVVCVFRHHGKILVGDAFDPTKQQWFYCPTGGRIEFGETSEIALRREIREEIGSEIENPVQLGVLENLFTFDGKEGHEIVFVYDAELADKSLYTVDRFIAQESNGENFNAIWLDLSTIGPDTPPLYPNGLLELLKKLLFIFILIGFSSALLVNAEPAGDSKTAALQPIDIEINQLLDKDQSTNGQVQTLAKGFDLWDAELNRIYKELMVAYGKNASLKKSLKETQLAWIKFRDAEFKHLQEIHATKEGSMYRIFLASNRMELVKTRALELKSRLDLFTDAN